MKSIGLSLGIVAMALACGDAPTTAPGAAAIDTDAAVFAEESDTFADEELSLDDMEFEPAPTDSGLASVRFSPDPPVPGSMLRALVSVNGRGQRQSFTYTWSIAGHRLVEDKGAIALPKLVKGDRVEVSVAASDGSGAPVTAETKIPNTRPKLLELKLELEETREGEVWKAAAWGTDPDNDPLEYEYTWIVNGKRHSNQGETFAVDQLERGDSISVRVVANDGESRSAVAESGAAEVANTPPTFVSSPPPLDRDGSYHYEAKAEDADGDRSFEFELVEGPDGMEIDRLSGLVTWTPTHEQAGRHPVEIAVEDKHDGRSTQRWTLPVVVVTTDFEESPAALP